MSGRELIQRVPGCVGVASFEVVLVGVLQTSDPAVDVVTAASHNYDRLEAWSSLLTKLHVWEVIRNYFLFYIFSDF